MIDKMTEKEKAAFLSGKDEWKSRDIPRLQIPSLFFSDGPSGVRKQKGEGDHLGLNPSVPATCFPSAATIANSWDQKLAYEVGKGLGSEAVTEGVDVLLGPGMNIKRNPLCGRNFEYFSEDPYLTGKLAAAIVRGIQKCGVSACVKHFAVNSQETRRMAMNAVIDERTLREMYLTGFEIAVKEAYPGAVMSSYNEVNGVYANENRHLLQEILREEWKFKGFVVTDWGGSNDHVMGVKNGSNLEMPNPGLDSARELLAAKREGVITQDEIDQRVDELLNGVLRIHENTEKYRKEHPVSRDEIFHKNHRLAQKAAAESIVLLKNEEEILPLKKEQKIAIIGDFAFEPRYQGAGSSLVNATFVETIQQKIDGYPELEVLGMSRGYRRDGLENENLEKEALELAGKADIVLFFFGLNEQSESEGLDREHLRIPDNQIRLIGKLSSMNSSLVGILSAGAVCEMPWKDKFQAMLYSGLSGQAGASAVLDVLTGRVNPSGKLSETIPLKYEDTPSAPYYPARKRNSEYRESIYVGYRYFETIKKAVAYPFGFGLSYTSFSYSDMQVHADSVSFLLKNTGTRAGAEIVQMYIGKKERLVFRPEKELKGFQKVYLEAGEEKRIQFFFDEYTFRIWNAEQNKWSIEEGIYQIMIGSNCQKILLEGDLWKSGDMRMSEVFENDSFLSDYRRGRIEQISDQEYETLLGHPIPEEEDHTEIQINDALCSMCYAKNGIARKVGQQLQKNVQKKTASGLPDLNALFQYNMPFRAIAKMTNGMVSMAMIRDLLKLVNNRGMKGAGSLLVDFVRNRKENQKYEEELHNS